MTRIHQRMVSELRERSTLNMCSTNKLELGGPKRQMEEPPLFFLSGYTSLLLLLPVDIRLHSLHPVNVTNHCPPGEPSGH